MKNVSMTEEKVHKIIVIGSGAASAGCILGLLDRGETEITVLDTGYEIEVDLENEIDHLKTLTEKEFVAEVWSKYYRNNRNKELVDKLTWGSSFVYDGSQEFSGLVNTGFKGSFAMGGLSRAWGTAIQRYRNEELQEWPIKLSELEPYYNSIEKIIPSTNNSKKKIKTQRYINKIFYNTKPFKKNKIDVFDATIALAADECTYCGQCLTGCYLDLLFSTKQIFKKLISEKRIHYIQKSKVLKINQTNGGTFEVICENNTFKARNVFLGAGCLHTTQIVTASMPTDEPILIEETAYILIPVFSLFFRKDKDNYHAASQKFLRYQDIHIQVYGYSPYIKHELQGKIPHWFPFKNFISEVLARHFLILQVFFNSKDSYKIEILKSSSEKLKLGAISERNTLKIKKKSLIKALFRSFLSRGAIVLSPFTIQAKVGRSFHFGGTFPMGKCVDKFGSFPNKKGLFLIDSSVFPNIPGSTILLTIMANAMRIGKESPLSD